MNETAVVVEDLVKTFPTGGEPLRAVDHINFTIQQGEVVAFLGPNGAGKTTTIDMLLGITAPTSGRVELMGLDAEKGARSGRVSAVQQTRGLLDDFTVHETMRVVGSTFKLPRSRIDEQMRVWGLEDYASRKVRKCSGGQQQRLRFALAMLPDPDLLLLDEPTMGLDVDGRRHFWSQMHQAADEGRTIIFATHYLGEAEEFADRVILINHGKIIADGPIAEVRASVSGSTVTAVWPGVDAAILDRLPHVNHYDVKSDTIAFTTDESDDLVRHLLNHTEAHDVLVARTTLEDAFLSLTSESNDQTEDAS
ncbi:ABC transporter ATP-binding protein [Cutibacterium equinum]|uniref:ABC transporter ATP-binding protein n=1 Tax=Cutibacterium equinum TaxID=3016342 RepID=A0ABY7QZ95_9ACTN|nr:ABC transporter ATP-binding protein [Cutibacterium equinum]WCC80311.1 ABC transporter ATP-binding protein [Cutibacterium equinum]